MVAVGRETQGMARAYARALEEARREFAAGLPAVMAQGAGTSFDPETSRFAVPLLDQPLGVAYPEGVVSAGGREADVGVVVVVLHYLAHSVGPLELGGGVRYMRLPGASAFAAAFRSRVEVPLLTRFGEDKDAFVAAVRALDGRESGGLWELPFLPHLPLAVRLGLAEGPMPAECVVLFPRRAGFVYPVEDLAVVGQLLAARLLALADGSEAPSP